MLIPKISSIKNFQCSSCKISRHQNLNKIQKVKLRKEYTKDILDPIPKPPKLKEIQKIRLIYKPINPQNKFSSSSFGINEMMKKDNSLDKNTIILEIKSKSIEKSVEEKEKRNNNIFELYEIEA